MSTPLASRSLAGFSLLVAHPVGGRPPKKRAQLEAGVLPQFPLIQGDQAPRSDSLAHAVTSGKRVDLPSVTFHRFVLS
jgi:hypothetical protein